MYSKFPTSSENFPRHNGFLCLSLKYGCVITALFYLLYCSMGLALCASEFIYLPEESTADYNKPLNMTVIAVSTITISVSFVLTVLLLFGVLRDSPKLVRPWIVWTTIQTFAYIIIFVASTTMQMLHHFAGVSLMGYVLDFLVLVVQIYMLILIGSFYKDLTEHRTERHRLRQQVDEETWYSYVRM